MTPQRLLGTLLVVLASVACAQPGSPSASDDRTTVVASFYPVWEAASRIAGDGANVENLTPAGVEPHDLELTSTFVDRIIDADVLLYLGHGFQPAVEDAVDEATGVKIDLLDGITLREGAAHEDEHAAEEDEQASAEDDGEEEAEDPHVWLDPKTWSKAVGRIERALVEADPDHEDDYRQRAATYRASLDALDDDYGVGLDTCTSRTIVTSHAAFAYLADRYDLEQVAITGVSPEADPSPKRLAEITDLVEQEHITTIFTETLVSPRVAETLAREAGVKTAVLNPIEGLTSDELDEGLDYADVMRQNLSILRKALGCR